MKTKIIGLFTLSVLCITVKAQLRQRFDNTNYKAIYFSEACRLIANTPDLLLIDVRSPGEYADSSSAIGYNIGRLNGAINISIDSIEAHYNKLKLYKDRPILLYCSHSQRSRVVSKLLADSGFKKVYSLNGGMTQINRASEVEFPCKSSLYTSNIPYKLIGADDAVKFIQDKKNIILDVRTATEFNNTDTTEYKNIGRIKSAINIPKSDLDREMSKLEKYKTQSILICDLSVSEAMKVALKMTNNGFEKVYVLFDGFDALLTSLPSASKLRKDLFVNTPSYKIIGNKEVIALVNQNKDLFVADIRPKEEFENKAKMPYRNLGHIKGGINFTNAKQLETYLDDKPKTTPILIYAGVSPNNTVNPSAVSKKLIEKGYTNIYVLYGGLYSLVWASANVEYCKDAATILVDHQGLY